ncbi:FAD-binding oxidoreductase [Pyrinomonas methylaliphatogenes]|uniref:FAD/FMN-dependent dehydrogenase n=1 Tax=Pyrinomonas methylaliphatogenes TaxID=454194 RepID=A0A0B6WSV1_9BACT|nr:FAD-binding oxidoreductase [Pyrinomonas methylaliphatogenes]CDM64313.1 FAD/FMN-dependent dehydrogenase [Pyrinomonas methylaliphatogenes]
MKALIAELGAIVGRDQVIAEPDELLVYECDGLPHHKSLPRAVVFPRSTEEAAEVVRTLARHKTPFTPRGAGTGLSGGATALDQSVIIELSRMRRILEIAPEDRLAVVETGVINAHLSRAAAPFGLYYAPDPSSQATCTIGGNIAENAGGIHCLKYGVTVDHVLALRVVLPDGEIVQLGDSQEESSGYDLRGLFIGSEGTFGIATEATVRLMPLPPAVRTLLADFLDVESASRAVSAIIAAGIIPAALEMVDGATIRAVEASVFAAGLPLDAEAALLVELDGLEVGLDDEVEHVEAICREHGARTIRRAANERERAQLWAARKGAFGAMGRIAPDLLLQDAVVPRSRLPELLAETYRIGAKYGLIVANVFHAGDGNLHPYICFDSRDRDQVRRVKEASREIMEACVRAGGTITGEHGVGLDKSEYMRLIFSEDDLETMLRIRAAFDPERLCNPGKILPLPRTCGEARAVQKETTRRALSSDVATDVLLRQEIAAARARTRERILPAHRPIDLDDAWKAMAAIVGTDNVLAEDETLIISPTSFDQVSAVLNLAQMRGWSIVPAGSMTWLNPSSLPSQLVLSTRALARLIAHEPADLVVTAEAGLTFQELNRMLAAHNQWLPIDPPHDERTTLGGAVATGIDGPQSLGYGEMRSYVIGMRVALADGRIIKAGGRVVKNVAGYDLCKLFTGSRGTLGVILELTFKLRPRPEREATIIARSERIEKLSEIARVLLHARLFPVAVELLSPRLADEITGLSTGDSNYGLAIRYAGTARTVSYQLDQTRAILRTDHLTSETLDDDTGLWRALNHRSIAPKLVCRIESRPSALISSIGSIDGQLPTGYEWRASLGNGRLTLFKETVEFERDLSSFEKLYERARAAGCRVKIERAPEQFKDRVKGAFNQRLVRLNAEIKEALDPYRTFPRMESVIFG